MVSCAFTTIIVFTVFSLGLIPDSEEYNKITETPTRPTFVLWRFFCEFVAEAYLNLVKNVAAVGRKVLPRPNKRRIEMTFCQHQQTNFF